MPRQIPRGLRTQLLLWVFAGSTLTTIVAVGVLAWLLGDTNDLPISSLAISAAAYLVISLVLTITGYWVVKAGS